MYYVSRIASVMVMLALLLAAWFSIRLAQADADFREGSPESVARAVSIMPRHPDYLALHALQLDYDGQDPAPTLQQIAALNPLASAPRIRLGLGAEVRGDVETAERWLLEAARIDRQFEPRWTLANYYFRRENASQFWKWMRLALEVSYGDRTPAFDLCWRESSDAKEILERAIPDRHEVLASYLWYLLDQKTTTVLPAAQHVALKLAVAGDPTDRAGLLAACDAFLAAGDASAALAVWRAMGYPPAGGVTAADFGPPRVGHGFDWRFTESTGVTNTPLDTPAGHRIAFSGRQPESCELLRQVLNLRPGIHYVLRWEARTQGLPSSSGIEWRISEQHAPVGSSSDWRAGERAFTASSALPVLILAYQRPFGEPRAEGWVELRHISVAESGK